MISMSKPYTHRRVVPAGTLMLIFVLAELTLPTVEVFSVCASKTAAALSAVGTPSNPVPGGVGTAGHGCAQACIHKELEIKRIETTRRFILPSNVKTLFRALKLSTPRTTVSYGSKVGPPLPIRLRGRPKAGPLFPHPR